MQLERSPLAYLAESFSYSVDSLLLLRWQFLSRGAGKTQLQVENGQLSVEKMTSFLKNIKEETDST